MMDLAEGGRVDTASGGCRVSNADWALTVSWGATSYGGRVGDVCAELLAYATTAWVDSISLEFVRCEMDGGGRGAEVADRPRKSMKGLGTLLGTAPAEKDVGKRLNTLGVGSLRIGAAGAGRTLVEVAGAAATPEAEEEKGKES